MGISKEPAQLERLSARFLFSEWEAMKSEKIRASIGKRKKHVVGRAMPGKTKDRLTFYFIKNSSGGDVKK